MARCLRCGGMGRTEKDQTERNRFTISEDLKTPSGKSLRIHWCSATSVRISVGLGMKTASQGRRIGTSLIRLVSEGERLHHRSIRSIAAMSVVRTGYPPNVMYRFAP